MAIRKVISRSIEDGAVASADITNATIVTADIADDAVTGAKIENNPTIAGNLTVSGNFTSQGIDDNADATAMTISTDEDVMIGTTDESSGAKFIVGSSSDDKRGWFQGSNQYRVGLKNGSNNHCFIGSGGADNFRVSRHDGSTSLEVNGSGNIVLPVSSAGIYLGATSATAANFLNDYEEGTFTPTFGGSTGNPTVSYAVQLGTYVKVGNIVTVTASVIASGTPVGGAGNLQVKGLPFTGKSGIQQAGSVAFTNNLGTASGTTQMTCSIEGGVSFLNINSHEYSGPSSMSRTEAPAIQNSAPRIVCTICYETS